MTTFYETVNIGFFIHYFTPWRDWTFDLPAMPFGRLGRMSWGLGPVSMIIPPAFVMHGRRVFDVHLFK